MFLTLGRSNNYLDPLVILSEGRRKTIGKLIERAWSITALRRRAALNGSSQRRGLEPRSAKQRPCDSRWPRRAPPAVDEVFSSRHRPATPTPPPIVREPEPRTGAPGTPGCRVAALPSRSERSAAAGVLFLNRRTLHRTVGAENTTVARPGAQPRFAMTTLIEEEAGVGGHRLLRGKAAVRTGQHRFEYDLVHLRLSCERWMDTRHWWWP